MYTVTWRRGPTVITSIQYVCVCVFVCECVCVQVCVYASVYMSVCV